MGHMPYPPSSYRYSTAPSSIRAVLYLHILTTSVGFLSYIYGSSSFFHFYYIKEQLRSFSPKEENKREKERMKSFAAKVEEGVKGANGKPSVGPVYRNLLSEKGFPLIDSDITTTWDIFRFNFLIISYIQHFFIFIVPHFY